MLLSDAHNVFIVHAGAVALVSDRSGCNVSAPRGASCQAARKPERIILIEITVEGRGAWGGGGGGQPSDRTKPRR